MKKKIFLIILFFLIILTLVLLGFFLLQKRNKENISPEKENLNCAIEGEKVNRNPLLGDYKIKCCPGLFEWRISKSYSYCLKPVKEGISIEVPKENEKIKKLSKVKGQAKGDWFFEGEFRVEIYDDNDILLGQTILNAKENWMTEKFVGFEGILNFTNPKTPSGKLIFLSANPSGLPENQKVYEMKIQFDNSPTREVFLYYYNPNKDIDEMGNIKCSRDGLVAIKREIPLTRTPIQDTINLLLEGKENLTDSEFNQGIDTEYPLEGFKLKSANLKKDGSLFLEFEDPFNKTIGGSCRVGILWFQIEATAKQFTEVKKVYFIPDTLFQP